MSQSQLHSTKVSSAGRRRQTTRDTKVRQQLIDYAIRRFTESGYHTTSVSEIVDGVGVGKGAFYWYFTSKEVLFSTLLHEARKDARAAQDAAIGDEPDALRRIELYIRSTIAWNLRNAARAQLFAIAETDHQLRQHLGQGRAEARNYLEEHVRAGIAAGQIVSCDPVMVAAGVLAVLQRLSAFLGQGRAENEVAETVVRLCLHGIATPK